MYVLKLTLCLNKYHTMKAYPVLHAFSTSVLNGGEWSAPCPSRFTPRKTAPGTHLLGGWAGSQAGKNVAVNRKNPFPASAWNQTPVAQLTD